MKLHLYAMSRVLTNRSTENSVFLQRETRFISPSHISHTAEPMWENQFRRHHAPSTGLGSPRNYTPTLIMYRPTLGE